MADVTQLSKETIYRDSKDWYLSIKEALFHPGLIRLCNRYAGKRILDVGCATGNYCVELKNKGFECVGVDINEAYVKVAQTKGIQAYVAGEKLPFNDGSFDTVIMFELLEHSDNVHELLQEAKRVAKKNILITVPNCSALEALRNAGLAYEHCLELDHKNFFTKKDLEALLCQHFKIFRVEEIDPLVLWRVDLPRWLRIVPAILYRLKIIPAKIYYRLFAIVEMKEE